jgi:hypothetical protein
MLSPNANTQPRGDAVGATNRVHRQSGVRCEDTEMVIVKQAQDQRPRDGTFQAAQSYAAGSGSGSVAVGDFNGDGFPDAQPESRALTKQPYEPSRLLESTIPSFCHEVRTAPDMLVRRAWTREWWDDHRSDFDLVTSEAVLDEIGKRGVSTERRCLGFA